MAIENELKYVLRIDAKDEVKARCQIPVMIRQGYLPGKARIRSKVVLTPKFFFTYKLPVKNVIGEDVVFEIEREITQHEFDTLWPHTDRRLTKLRYVYCADEVQWDIDFFMEGNDIYFAMAEAEMPEDMSVPPYIPEFLESTIIFPVPRGMTKAFTSARIADPLYAKKLLNEIAGEKKRKKKK